MVSSWAAAAGATSSANTSSAPVIWLVAATASAEHEEKRRVEDGDRQPARSRGLGVDRLEEQRPRRTAISRQRRHRDDQQGQRPGRG